MWTSQKAFQYDPSSTSNMMESSNHLHSYDSIDLNGSEQVDSAVREGTHAGCERGQLENSTGHYKAASSKTFTKLAFPKSSGTGMEYLDEATGKFMECINNSNENCMPVSSLETGQECGTSTAPGNSNSGQSTVQSFRKKRSIVWKFMLQTGNSETKCRLCHKCFQFSGSTSSMMKHVIQKHMQSYNSINAEGEGHLGDSNGNHTPASGAATQPQPQTQRHGETGLEYLQKATANSSEYSTPDSISETRHQSKTFSTPDNVKVGDITPEMFEERIALSSDTSDKKKKSVVWKFMAKTSPSETKCRLCKKRFHFSGSTSSMMKHLLKHQQYCRAMDSQALSGTEKVAVTRKNGRGKSKSVEPGGVEKCLDDPVRNDALVSSAVTKLEIPQSSDNGMNYLGEATRECMQSIDDSNENFTPVSELETAQESGTSAMPDNSNSGQSKAQSFRKKRSVVWKFMIQTGTSETKCRLCKRSFQFSGSTSSMMKHLLHNHSHKSINTERVKRNVAWKYFSISGPKEVKCKICGLCSQFSGSTSFMVYHLKKEHSVKELSDIEKRKSSLLFKSTALSGAKSRTKSSPASGSEPSSPVSSWEQPDVDEQTSLDCPDKTSSVTDQGTKLCSDEDIALLLSSKTGLKQPLDERAKLQLDQLIVDMVISELLPCSLFERTSVRKFVTTLNPRVGPALPNREAIETSLANLHVNRKNQLQLEIDFCRSISVSTEVWTYRGKHQYLTVSGHFVSPTWKLESVVLQTARLDSDTDLKVDISEHLRQILTDWNILNKVVCIVTDHSKEMAGAVSLLDVPHVLCASHTLNLIIQQCMNLKSGYIAHLAAGVKDLAPLVNLSEKAPNKSSQVKRAEKKTPKRPVKDTECNWLRAHRMFRSYLESHSSLDLIVRADSLLGAEDMELLTRWVQVVKPFALVAEEMASDGYSTLSKSLPVFEILRQKTQNHVEQESPGTSLSEYDSVTAMAKGLAEEVDHFVRHIKEGVNLLPLAATLLDPRFKHLQSETPGVHKRVELEIQKHLELGAPIKTEPGKGTEDAAVDSLWTSFDEQVPKCEDSSGELRRYMEESPIPRKEDPLQYWQNREWVYPGLCKAAKRFLCIPAACVRSGQVFSEQGSGRDLWRSTDSVLFLRAGKWPRPAGGAQP